MLGFVMAIFIIFAYYIVLSVGQTYGDDGRLPGWAAMWMPNLVMGLLALAAGYGAFREKGIFAFARA
jgi:lipopolysaccharide export LptBFGC system permease protein LptF